MAKFFHKVCTKCGRERLVTAFYVTNRDYLMSWCKDCVKEKRRRLYQNPEVREAALAMQRAYLQSERGKATKRAWHRSEARQEWLRRYRATDAFKNRKRQHDAKYRAKPEAKARRAAWLQTEEARAAAFKFNRTAAGRERARRYAEANRERRRGWYLAWMKTPEGREASRRGSAKRRALLMGQVGVVATLTATEWQEILEEHSGACRYCGRTDVPMTQDHVIPLKVGGLHVKDNVVPACQPCNSRKGARPLPPDAISLTTGS